MPASQLIRHSPRRRAAGPLRLLSYRLEGEAEEGRRREPRGFVPSIAPIPAGLQSHIIESSPPSSLSNCLSPFQQCGHRPVAFQPPPRHVLGSGASPGVPTATQPGLSSYCMGRLFASTILRRWHLNAPPASRPCRWGTCLARPGPPGPPAPAGLARWVPREDGTIQIMGKG